MVYEAATRTKTSTRPSIRGGRKRPATTTRGMYPEKGTKLGHTVIDQQSRAVTTTIPPAVAAMRQRTHRGRARCTRDDRELRPSTVRSTSTRSFGRRKKGRRGGLSPSRRRQPN